jgi:hypothetical protein
LDFIGQKPLREAVFYQSFANESRVFRYSAFSHIDLYSPPSPRHYFSETPAKGRKLQEEIFSDSGIAIGLLPCAHRKAALLKSLMMCTHVSLLVNGKDTTLIFYNG